MKINFAKFDYFVNAIPIASTFNALAQIITQIFLKLSKTKPSSGKDFFSHAYKQDTAKLFVRMIPVIGNLAEVFSFRVIVSKHTPFISENLERFKAGYFDEISWKEDVIIRLREKIINIEISLSRLDREYAFDLTNTNPADIRKILKEKKQKLETLKKGLDPQKLQADLIEALSTWRARIDNIRLSFDHLLSAVKEYKTANGAYEKMKAYEKLVLEKAFFDSKTFKEEEKAFIQVFDLLKHNQYCKTLFEAPRRSDGDIQGIIEYLNKEMLKFQTTRNTKLEALIY